MTDLVAHKGLHKHWHFKHASSETCAGSVETALHLRSKEILKESTFLHLPLLHVHSQGYFSGFDVFEESNFTVVPMGKKIMLDANKDVERKIGDFTPDVIVYVSGKPLAVEVAVTHFVDEDKAVRVAESKISCIEIDLSDYIGRDFSDGDLKRSVIEDALRSRWIYNAFEVEAARRCDAVVISKLALYGRAKGIESSAAYLNGHIIDLNEVSIYHPDEWAFHLKRNGF